MMIMKSFDLKKSNGRRYLATNPGQIEQTTAVYQMQIGRQVVYERPNDSWINFPWQLKTWSRQVS